jgi:hypothetical protein
MFGLPTTKDNFVVEFNVTRHEVQDIVNKIVVTNELINKHGIKCSLYLHISTSSYGEGVFARLTVEGTMNGDTVSMVYNLENSLKDKFISVDLSKFDRR